MTPENQYILQIVPATIDHIPGIVALQRACFPPPFPEEFLWQPEHIASHIRAFPQGQFVALKQNQIVASCTNMRVAEVVWNSHLPWQELTGGLHLPNHNPNGKVLYGIDISVHPDHRKQGIAKSLYQARIQSLKELDLTAYGTVCRLPGFATSGYNDPQSYAQDVARHTIQDPTLTPLLKMNLTYIGVISNYMEDEESGHAGAILELRP